MTRKNLKISPETYEDLLEHKGGRTWDEFLSDLVADPSEDTVRLSSEQVEEIVRLVSDSTVSGIKGVLPGENF